MPVCARGKLVLRLFEDYYERVYWFARRSVEPSSAEDVAQEVFVRLLHVPDLESKTISVSYLLKMADNLLKRRHRRHRQFEEYAGAEGPGRADACYESELDEPEAKFATVGFERLTDGERDAVRFIVCEGLSYDAAARALDVRTSTVNNWKFRGMQKLKDSGVPSQSVAV
jgi:RNA polymerase sigma factor (sigma-70 family)